MTKGMISQTLSDIFSFHLRGWTDICPLPRPRPAWSTNREVGVTAEYMWLVARWWHTWCSKYNTDDSVCPQWIKQTKKVAWYFLNFFLQVVATIKTVTWVMGAYGHEFDAHVFGRDRADVRTGCRPCSAMHQPHFRTKTRWKRKFVESGRST